MTRRWSTLSFLAVCLWLAAAAPAAAQAVNDGGVSRDYLDMLPSQAGENWLTRQFSEFSSYPVIDKAMRLASEGNTGAARQELQNLLRDQPENLRARFMLVVLLHGMKEYTASATEATTFLQLMPDFGPAHLYRGLDLAETGDDPDTALADLNAAITSTQVSEGDRTQAVDTFIQTAIDAGKFAQALQQLDRQPNQGTFRHLRLRGLVLDGMEDYTLAQQTFQQAADVAATNEERLEALKFAAESARKAGDADGARTILLDALESAPGDYTIMRQLAWVELSAGNSGDAWEWIMLALDSDPDVETRVYLINLLIEAKDSTGALMLLDRQIADAAKAGDEALRRQLIDTKFNLLVQEESYDAAFEVLDGELETVSDIAYLVILLEKKANLHTQLDEYIEAGLAYRELLSYIDDPNVLIALATSMELGGDLKQAAEYLEQAADFIGLRGVAYQLVDIYKQLNDYEAALRVLDKAVVDDADPAFQAQLLYTKATILHELGRLDEERESLIRAVELDPANQLYLLALGDLNFALGKYDRAVLRYETALKLADNLDVRRRLAYAQAANDNLTQALDNFEIVLPTLEPRTQDRAEILNGIANIYARLDRQQDAAEGFLAAYEEVPGQPVGLLVQAATAFTVVKEWQKAADLYERALASPSLDRAIRNNVYESMAVVMDQLSRPAEAARYYTLLLDNQDMDDARRLSILRRLAIVSETAKDYASATRAYRGMIENPLVEPKERRDLLFRVAVTAELAGDYDEAIQAYRDILAFDDLTLPERLDALKKMAVIANIAGQPEVAAEAYRFMLAGEDLPIEDRIAAATSLAFVSTEAELDTSEVLADLQELLADQRIQGADRIGLLRGLAVMSDMAGRPDVVADAYEQIIVLMPENDPDRDKVLDQLANAYERTGRPEMAVPIYLDLLARLELADDARIELLRRLAVSAQLSGQNQIAFDAFQEIIDIGTTDWTVYQSYGLGLREAGDCKQAVRAFNIARSLGADYNTDIYASFCYTDMGQKGLALHYTRIALARGAADMPLTQRFSMLAAIGFLYSETQQFKLAAKAWRAAIAIAPDPILTLRLARVERLSGEIERATERLASLENIDLPPTLRADYYDEIAEIEMLEGDSETALAAIDNAIALISTNDRLFRRGLLLNETGDLDGAIDSLEQAATSDSYTILAALGYAYNSAGRDLESEHLLETVVRAQPDRLAPYTDLAYINKRGLLNDQAIRWFELAIDNEPLYPIDEDDKLELEQQIWDFRRENQTLNNIHDFSAYSIVRSQFGSAATVFDPTGSSTLVSQGGMEYAYRLDDFDWIDDYPLGFRDGETLHAFVRTFWGYKDNSILIDRDTIQGGAGLRWKPIADKSFYLSGERLFRIGSQARNDWLLRASYGWDTGYDIEPVRDDWPFATVFTDVAWIPGNDWSVFLTAEGRLGRSYKYGEQTVITPHVMSGVYDTESDTGSTTIMEFGPGISVKYWFDDTKYQAFRSAAEVIVQYRGAVVRGDGFSSGIVGTLLVSF